MEELRCELLAVIGDQRFRRSVFEYPCLHESDGYRIRVYSSQRDNLRAFRKAVGNSEQKPVAFLRFRERSEDFDREAFERTLGREES